MKLRTISALILTLIISVQLAKSEVIFGYGSIGQEYGRAITVDKDDNFIVAASFQNTINVNPNGTLNLTAVGDTDIVIAKYDWEGNLLWAKGIGGTDAETVPLGMTVDDAGNIYLVGYFGTSADENSRTVDFDPGAAEHSLTSKSGYDAFLAKYDASGNYLWALALGNPQAATNEIAWDVAVDASGNIYIGGVFKGSVDFNPLGTANVLTSYGVGNNHFLAKYNSSGINQWAYYFVTKIENIMIDGFASVDVDSEGNCYFAGNYRTPIDLDPAHASGTSVPPYKGESDIFVASYTSAGAYRWGIGMGGTNVDILSPGAMRVDGVGNIFITGHFRGIAEFNPLEGESLELTAIGKVDNIFVASYGGADGAVRWAFSVPSIDGIDGGSRVAFDNDNNLFVSGWIAGSGDFEPGPGGLILDANGMANASDAFLAKYTNDGAALWAHNFGSASVSGSDKLTVAAGLAVDSKGNAYICGQFFGANADFDPSNKKNALSSAGENDCFVAKYDAGGNLWVKPKGTITVITPNGGETWYIGQKNNITWQSVDVANMKIDYSTNSGVNWLPVTPSTPAAAQTYSWTIPDVNSTKCSVRISDASDAEVKDLSDGVFTITNPPLNPQVRVLSPNGGETWIVNTVQHITWQSQDINYLMLEYSTDNADHWIPIKANAPAAQGYYEWTIPNTPGFSCLVRVTDALHTNISDMSDGLFEISTGIGVEEESAVSGSGIKIIKDIQSESGNSHQIEFSLAKPGNIEIDVYNSIGQAVGNIAGGFYAADTNNIEFSTALYPTGVYYYRIVMSGGGSAAGRFVVVR